tara:strand:+ start:257 stop:988 length:732 start_codon:yes stop_codon:yes gene_type:complete
LLFAKNLVNSRQEAIGLILSGNVFIDSQRIDKPGTKVETNCNLVLKKKDKIWVSRGGYKLDQAIREFDVDCKNIIVMDIGSSTGGFTDVLIKKGAKKVYSVDVGYGQLDWNIRNNSRVVVLEKTNARYLNNKLISDKLDAIVCDVSFISLKKIIKPNIKFLKTKGWLICLIKPQFEIGKNLLVKGGVVKNIEHHQMVVDDIRVFFENEINLNVKGIIESPILGPKGNKEFLIYAQKKLENLFG